MNEFCSERVFCKSNLFANPTEIAQVSNKYNQLYTTAFKLASRHPGLKDTALLYSIQHYTVKYTKTQPLEEGACICNVCQTHELTYMIGYVNACSQF